MYKKRPKRYRKKTVLSLPFQGESSKKFDEFQGPANPKSQIPNPKSGDFAITNFALASFAVTGFLLFAIHLGLLQPLELAAYDQMVRLVQNKQPDPRLLVVAITEADIRAQRWPLSDRTVAQVLQNLQQYKPKVIGLDIYRDVPQQPGYELFLQQLKSPNIIVITDDAAAIPPPKAVPKERIGFNDLLVDPDGVIRRNLLFIPTETGVLRSFSLLLAQAYLADRGILPKSSGTKPAYLQLGKAVFTRLESDSGGYQNIDARGYQILLNYRSAQPVARQVTLAEVIGGQVNPSWIEDKIVIIGSTAPSLNDLFLTPYSPTQQENYKMPGVLIHAQMVSQILNAAIGEKPLFWFWDEWMEVLWILGWALIGGSLAAYFRRPLVLSILAIGAIALLILSCFYLFTQHGWVPIASPILAVSIASGAVVLNRCYVELIHCRT